MKTKITLILSLALLSFFAGPVSTNAQSTKDFMDEVMEDSQHMILGGTILDLSFSHLSIDKFNSETDVFRTLYDENEYYIYVGGDSRVVDIDLEVYKLVNNEWEFVDEDEDTDKEAQVILEANETASYRFVVDPYEYSSGEDDAFYYLLILYK